MLTSALLSSHRLLLQSCERDLRHCHPMPREFRCRLERKHNYEGVNAVGGQSIGSDAAVALNNWGERERAPSCGLNGRAVTIDITRRMLCIMGRA